MLPVKSCIIMQLTDCTKTCLKHSTENVRAHKLETGLKGKQNEKTYGKARVRRAGNNAVLSVLLFGTT